MRDTMRRGELRSRNNPDSFGGRNSQGADAPKTVSELVCPRGLEPLTPCASSCSEERSGLSGRPDASLLLSSPTLSVGVQSDPSECLVGLPHTAVHCRRNCRRPRAEMPSEIA